MKLQLDNTNQNQ